MANLQLINEVSAWLEFLTMSELEELTAFSFDDTIERMASAELMTREQGILAEHLLDTYPGERSTKLSSIGMSVYYHTLDI